MIRALVSWSSGKDAAWALHVLRQRPDVEVVGLLTTLNGETDRISMHAVRRELLRAQAAAAGLPLREIDLPWPCSNEIYESVMTEACARAVEDGVTHVVFGDIFLDDVRQYRIDNLKKAGLEALFPLWGRDTAELARQMIGAGLRAIITTIDERQISTGFLGRVYDEAFLDDLPPDVDPCGERGEFHTFVVAGPMFDSPIPVEAGERVEDGDFRFADLRFARGASPERVQEPGAGLG